MADLKTKTFINEFKLWDESRLKELSDRLRKLFAEKAPEYIAELKKERKIKQDKEIKSDNAYIKVPAPGIQVGEGEHTYNHGGKIK